MTEPPTAESEAPIAPQRPALATLGMGAGWLIGLRAAIELVRGVLGSAPLAEAVIGAFILDVAAGRAGIVWSPASSRRSFARSIALGLALGVMAVVPAMMFAVVSKAATLARGHFDWTLLLSAIGVVGAATRDELLFRGFPLFFIDRARLDPRIGLVFAALLSATPDLVGSHATLEGVFSAMASGALFATLWRATGSGLVAVAAHVAWSLALGALSHGSAIEFVWSHGELADGLASRGAVAWVLGLGALGCALVANRRLRRPDPRAG